MSNSFSDIKRKIMLSRSNATAQVFYNSGSESDNSSETAEHSNGLLEKMPFEVGKRSIWSRYRNFIVFHVALFVIYAGLLISVASHRPECVQDRGMPFSPAIEALEYEEATFSLEDRIQDHGPYSGKPRPELDQAWHDLLNYENIMLEPEVMKHYGREDTGVALPEGNGYIGTLNVYHELHCLKRIHQYMYEDHYFPGIDDNQREMNRLHNEHCIDFLRRSAMCHGDIGLITFEWKEYSRIPVANATQHQCVKWDKLDSWTRARSVDMMKPGWLVHPTLGLAYPDGEGDKIGAAQPGHGHNH